MIHSFSPCPHCLGENIAFNLEAAVQKTPITSNNPRAAGPLLLTTFWICQKCFGGVCAEATIERLGTGTFISSISSMSSSNCSNLDYKVLVKKWYPQPQPLEAPRLVPAPVTKAFIQGLSNLKQMMYEPSLMMMRKAVDLALKEIAPAAENLPLAKRIDKAVEAGLLTKDLAQWAHEIRIFGNEAVHDPVEVSEQEAAEIKDFTELFLMYVFTLPGMLAERRAKAPA